MHTQQVLEPSVNSGSRGTRSTSSIDKDIYSPLLITVPNEGMIMPLWLARERDASPLELLDRYLRCMDVCVGVDKV